MVETGGRDAGEGERVVVNQGSLVAREAHLFDAVVKFGAGLPGFLEPVFGLRLVVDVEVGEAFSGGGELVEDGGIGDPTLAKRRRGWGTHAGSRRDRGALLERRNR